MNKNDFKLFTVILSLSLTGLIIFVLFFLPPIKKVEKIYEQKNNFHLAIPNDLDFYEMAYRFKKKNIDLSNKKVIGGIIPHHLLAADLIAEFFSNFKSIDYDTVILIGPNHFLAGNADIITSAYDWQTPYGILECDQKVLDQLLKFNEIKVEEKIFQNEHSINGETAFVKKIFPVTKFLPIVLKPSVDQDEAEKLAEYLFKIFNNRKILVLASVDFSHYKDSATAQINDKISIDAIKNFSFDKIYDLDIDSPASIYVLLKFSELSGANFELLNNANSAILADKPGLNSTTSYVTGYFIARQNIINKHLPNNTEEPIQMLFFGDMMLDRHVGEKIKKYGLDYIFEKLEDNCHCEERNEVERQSNPVKGEFYHGIASPLARNDSCFFANYDLISCNLEGTVTNNGAHYNPIMSYDFAFAPELIGQLKNYNFNFFNIANNHLADQGERGIIETRENLEKLGFNYSGCCDGKVGECSSTVVEITDKRIGIAGFSMVYSKLDMAEAEKVINNLASTTDLVIVNMHWGIEYDHQFNKAQQEVAHSLIDAGADIIIGHHPHVVQGIELYQGKPIFYSLGNFVFDQYFSADTQEGLAVGINIDDQKTEFFLYLLKSKLNQIELMDGNEKEKFLQKLAEWSEVDDKIKEQIKIGKLVL